MRVILCAVIALIPVAARAQSIPALTPRVVLEGPNGLLPALGTKADVENGTLKNPTISGGSLDGAQTVTTGTGLTQPLSALLGQQINVVNYGAVAGGTDSGTAIEKAITAAANGFPVYFPYSSYGYTLNTGSYTGRELGTWELGGNAFSGAAIGNPQAGTGTLISPYTNPYVIATDSKKIFDPARVPNPSKGAAVAESVECLPNRTNGLNANTSRNWIACRYVGADTGTGGTPLVDLSTEVENWVLNVSGNHGLAFEIDTNFNAAVTDGQWSTGLFLTGGGAAGTNVNSVALSIMHAAYDGSWLPWTTGLSIRETTNQIEQYRSSAAEAGFFQRAWDENNNVLYYIQKNGSVGTTGSVSAGGQANANGFVAKVASGNDDFVATRQSASDVGFFFRAFDENGNQLAEINKSGGATVANFVNTNRTGAAAGSACSTAGEMHSDDLNIYVCMSTLKYAIVPLTH